MSSRKKTTEEFIIEAKNVHGNIYDYGSTVYDGAHKKVIIKCGLHGPFTQHAFSHLTGIGCRICSALKRSGTTESFIKKSKEIHGDKYDYRLVEYINTDVKVKIICPEHGVFEQSPDSHSRSGCPSCSNQSQGSWRKLNTETFIERASILHNNLYSYDNSNYINFNSLIKIICPIHGEFSQTPANHLTGKGCNKCGAERTGLTFRKDPQDFIKSCQERHNYFYDYTDTFYTIGTSEIIVNCPEHGDFNIIAERHERGVKCPNCSKLRSKGELEISRLLTLFNIPFTFQKTFEGCRNKRLLPFDFHIPHLNLLIEFDGQQHFSPVAKWGGEEALEQTRIRDSIKDRYCYENNIFLLRIRFDENIMERLKFLEIIY